MKTKVFYTFVLLSFILFNSCSGDSFTGNTDSSTTGRLTVSLTDAPFPYGLVSEANVTIFRVDARRVSDDDTDDENEESFVTLMEEEIDVNLLDLTNGVTEQLADLDIPTGSYDLVRVFVRGVNVVLTDDRVFDLKVPSGEQTGIKVFIDPALTIVGGLSADLLLDFDVSRSFVVRGNIRNINGINGFIFKPVIKASNLSTAGTLTGRVSSLIEDMDTPLEGAQISVIAGDTINTTAFTNADGNYTIMGLEAGSYQAFAELEGFFASDTIDVQIAAANRTTQNFVLEVDDTSDETDTDTDTDTGN